jgi:hypothetical protein
MRWYAALFWLWLLGSLIILVVRRTNRSSDVEQPAERVDPLLKEWAPPPPLDPGDPERPDPGDLGGPVSGGRTGGEPPTGGSGDPTIDIDDPAASRLDDAAPARVTLADLLSGITLPHELVPLTQFGGTGDLDTHVVVATNRASAEMVGTGLADELERLGFSVETTGENTAVAEGPRGRLSIVVHPDGSAVLDGGTHRFPTASTGTVVVELRTP